EKSNNETNLTTNQPPQPSSDTLILERRKIRSFDDPHNLAQDFLEKHASYGPYLTLRNWRNQFYQWKWDRYEEVADYELRGKVSTFMRQEFDAVARKRPDNKGVRRAVTQRNVSDVLQAISAQVSIPARLEAPFLINRPTSTHRFF